MGICRKKFQVEMSVSAQAQRQDQMTENCKALYKEQND